MEVFGLSPFPPLPWPTSCSAWQQGLSRSTAESGCRHPIVPHLSAPLQAYVERAERESNRDDIVHCSLINPLTTEFFPPRQHIFMHSAHTTFVGTLLPQHSLLSGQTWRGPHTWRDPSGNTVNDIHDPHKPSNRRSKCLNDVYRRQWGLKG